MTMKIPRLEFEDLESRLAETLTPRYERLGYLGEFFKCMGHQPTALRGFIDFTEAAKGDLPKNLVEVIALTAATKLGNDYERHQHQRLSVRLGLGRDWVIAVERLDGANSEGLNDHERVMQQFVLAVLERAGKDSGAELEAVIDAIGYRQAVAALMVIGRYATHALIVNCLDLDPPVPSIYEDGFEG